MVVACRIKEVKESQCGYTRRLLRREVSLDHQITLATRFQGPPGTGNGGYVSGLLAKQLGQDALQAGIEVTLRAPTPLEQALQIRATPEKASFHSGEVLIGEAVAAPFDLAVPQAPTYAQALAAQGDSPSLDPESENIVPGGLGFHPVCFCCGADVPKGQGLRVFASAVPGFAGVAAAWRPHEAFADDAGLLPAEVIWGALDCPGQFAFYINGVRTGLLGRITAKILKPVKASDQIVIAGWEIGVDGKKHFAGTALFDQAGDCCAYSKQVWIGRMD